MRRQKGKGWRKETVGKKTHRCWKLNDSRELPSLKTKGLRHSRPRICNTGNSQGPGKPQHYQLSRAALSDRPNSLAEGSLYPGPPRELEHRGFASLTTTAVRSCSPPPNTTTTKQNTKLSGEHWESFPSPTQDFYIHRANGPWLTRPEPFIAVMRNGMSSARHHLWNNGSMETQFGLLMTGPVVFNFNSLSDHS